MKIRLGIQAKFILAFSLATGLILGIATYIYYQRSFDALDAELGNRLLAIGKIIVREVDVTRALYFEPGEESAGAYRNFQNKLESAATNFDLKNIYVINTRGEAILDAQGEASLGLPIAEHILPEKIMQGLQKGDPQTTPVYEEALGRLFKSAFLPLYNNVYNDDQRPVAFLRLDANPSFLASLGKIRRASIAAGAVTIPLAILIAAILAFSFLSPIRKLIAAANQIAKGNRNVATGLKGRDELALLGQTFDQMAVALREKEEHLQQLRSEAENRAEYMREMAGVVAHEVRNPLAATQGYLELLLRNAEKDSQAGKYGQSALEELGRLRKLVDTFLKFSRTPEIKRAPADPGEIVQNVLPIVQPKAQEKNVKLAVSTADHLPTISVDKDQLRDVLVNIALNAVDASPIGETVRLQLTEEGDSILFRVADKGPGIPFEISRKIFSPFFTTKSSGTGLGLPTAKRIVEAHGGTISVESGSGGGTTFIVSIPKIT